MSDDRYPSHSSYEESGIPSCPMRPAHWGTTRLKFISELNPSKSQVNHLDPQMTVTFLPMEAIGEKGELDVSQEKRLYEVRNGYTFLAEGDLCIAKITPCFENGKGAIISGTTNGIAFATTEVIPFRCKRADDTNFLYYMLTSAPFKPNAEASMYGAGGQKRVADSFAGNYSAVLPPPGERSQIAKFLDYETGKIDRLIEKQERLIALLKEKRQAVISHAVTKGLNPAVPMRDSGIEWLGEVPAHWEVGALKHVASTTNGYGFSSSDFQDEGVPFIRAGNIKAYSITPPKIFLPIKSVARFERLRMKPNEVLISMVGSDPSVKESAVGQIGVVPPDLAGAVPNQNVVIMRETSGKMTKRFLFHTLCSSAYRNHLDVFSHKLANQSIISSSLIVAAKVCVPPIFEQNSITQYLEARLPTFDSMIKRADAIIILLQERRTALISAAVTGKIDVRGWEPPTSPIKTDTTKTETT